MKTRFVKISLVLFTYNRPNHLKKCLTSIKKIKQIKKIFFFCDGPKNIKNNSDIKKIAECRKLISKVNWVSKEIYFQKKNIGIKNTLLLSAHLVFEKKKYDFAIYLEDDNIIHSNFYNFMRDCSKKFLKDKNIFSITGYNFILNKNLYSEIKSDYFFSNYTNTWSIGLWKRSWKLWKKEIQYLNQGPKREVFKKIIKSKNYLLYDALLEGYNKKNNAGSTFFYTAWKHKLLTIFPKYPLMSNIGMDGTGENCITTNIYKNDKKFPNKYKLKIKKKNLIANKKIDSYFNQKLAIPSKKVFFYQYCPFFLQLFLLKTYSYIQNKIKKF